MVTGGLLPQSRYMLSTTWNAPAESLIEPDQLFEGVGVDGLLIPLRKSFEFLGMRQMPTFAYYDIHKNAEAEETFTLFREHLIRNFGDPRRHRR